MKKRNDYYSTRFSEGLKHIDPRLQGLDERQLFQLGSLIQNHYTGRNKEYQHVWNPNARSISWQLLYDIFGKNYVHFSAPLFVRSEHYSIEHNVSKQSVFSKLLKEYCQEHYTNISGDSPLTDLHDSNGKVHQSPAATLPIDNLPRTIQIQDVGRPFIPVNIRYIEQAINYIDQAINSLHTGDAIQGKTTPEIDPLLMDLFQGNRTAREAAKDRLNRIYRGLQGILDRSINSTYGRGNLPISYKMTQAGRLSGQGTNHPQYIPREAKAIILKGTNWIEYDFSNCHYSILTQITDVDTPTIHNYLEAKQETRNDIANQSGLPVKQVKTALISLIYGALTSKQGKIYHDVCNRDDAKYKALTNHPIFKGIAKEVKTAGNDIIKQLTYTKSRHGRTYRNILDLKFTKKGKGNPTGSNARKLLAHALQGYEALSLQVMTQANPDSLRLYEYDGAVFSQNIDVEQAEYLIKKRANIQLNIDQKCTY